MYLHLLVLKSIYKVYCIVHVSAPSHHPAIIILQSDVPNLVVSLG